jgi:hypothetical protein
MVFRGFWPRQGARLCAVCSVPVPYNNIYNVRASHSDAGENKCRRSEGGRPVDTGLPTEETPTGRLAQRQS